MMKKRVAAASAAMLLTAGLVTTSPAHASSVASTMFTDVNGHWARPTIEKLAMLGIVNGFEGKANPDDSMTRAEFVTLLLRALDIQTNPQAPVTFNDIGGHWAKQTIATAAQLNMVNGVEAGKFAPDAPIQRDALAKLLTTNASSLEKDTSGAPPFRDISGNWGYNYIVTAYQTGLIKGQDNTHFSPTNNATRAEAFVMIERMLQKQTKGTLPSAAALDTLVNKVDSATQVLLNGDRVPAGYSANFMGPMQGIMDRVEKGQASIPSGLPPRGAFLEETHAMTVAENYIQMRTTTSTPGSDGERSYQLWDVYLMKKDGQWKIGDYAAVSQ